MPVPDLDETLERDKARSRQPIEMQFLPSSKQKGVKTARNKGILVSNIIFNCLEYRTTRFSLIT